MERKKMGTNDSFEWEVEEATDRLEAPAQTWPDPTNSSLILPPVLARLLL